MAKSGLNKEQGNIKKESNSRDVYDTDFMVYINENKSSGKNTDKK